MPRRTIDPDIAQESLQSMKEKASQNRSEAQTMLDDLEQIRGSRSERYMSSVWAKRFYFFYTNVQQKDLKQTPTGADIASFLYCVPQHLKAKNTATGIPSECTVIAGYAHLCKVLTFDYPDFDLTRNDKEIISNVLAKLLQDGQVTRTPYREKQWIGASLVQAIAESYLGNALIKTQPSWDGVLVGVTFLCVLASSCARISDLVPTTVSGHATDARPFLCYEDITIKFHGGKSMDDMICKLVIRNEKGAKNDPRSNREVRLCTLRSQRYNAMDPIKLFLILGARTGNLDGDTLEDVFDNTLARGDKTIQWRHPTRPVLFRTEDCDSYPNVSVTNLTMNTFLKLAASLAGFSAPVTPHDIRRGAARELAELSPDHAKGIANPLVASGIGHNHHTFTSGTTALYVGGNLGDLWTPRVVSSKPDPFGISATNPQLPYQPPKSLILNYARAGPPPFPGVSHSTTPEQGKLRKRTSSSSGNSSLEAIIISDTDSETTLEDHTGDTSFSQAAMVADVSSFVKAEPVDEEIEYSNWEGFSDDGMLDSAAEQFPTLPDLDDSDDDKNIKDTTYTIKEESDHEWKPDEDHNDTSDTEDVAYSIKDESNDEWEQPEDYSDTGDAKKSLWGINLLEEQSTSDHMASKNKAIEDFVHQPGQAFVAYFSTIGLANGKSKAKDGVQCSECSKRLATRIALQRHVYQCHRPFRHRNCKRPDCDQTILYRDKVTWRKHKKTHVKIDDFRHQTCPILSCNDRRMYRSHHSFRRHFLLSHSIELADTYSPERATHGTKKSEPGNCPVPGCGSKGKFAKSHTLRKHILDVHKSKELAEKYAPHVAFRR